MQQTAVPQGAAAQLARLLDAPRRAAIITHHNPDGDAIGSSLGLMHLLRAAGHRPAVLLPNAAPAFLHWMPGYGEAIPFDQRREDGLAALRQAEIVFCLDFNRRDRVGGLEQPLKECAAPTVLIDHHQEPEAFATVAFTDASACATCELVAAVADALGWRRLMGLDAATCLYTGLVTDSGSFRFSSTKPSTMRLAADLMELGVPFSAVHERIMDDNRPERLKLLGFTLNERMEVMPELGTAIIHLSLDDLKRFNHQPGDTEGFVNYGLSIRGIRLAAFFMERPDLVKVSFRSKGDLPVDGLARDHFSGGGHRNAAGGQAKEPLLAVVDRFRALVPGFIAQHP